MLASERLYRAEPSSLEISSAPPARCAAGASLTPKSTETTPTSYKFSHNTAVPDPLDRDALYAEFAPLVRRLMRQYGQDPELRQDLAGEIYCRFCALLQAYDPARGVPLRPYLVRQLHASIYTYARHHWRRQRREVELEIHETHPTQQATAILDPTRQWDEALAIQQVKAALPDAIAGLPARQRQVVLWRYYQSRSFEEIAEALGIQVATARSLLRHGLNNLRRVIGPRQQE
jgi:RNA polymerase sigma factor (sigma-70 family)